MSLTTPSNTLNTFSSSGPGARAVAICHDLFERDDASSDGRIITSLQTPSGETPPESGDSDLPS